MYKEYSGGRKREKRGGEAGRLPSQKIDELDSNRTFDSEISNKNRKTNSRLGSSNKKDEKGERLTSERVKRKRRKDEDKINSKKQDFDRH